MQRQTTLKILWEEGEDRGRIHTFSRSLAARISEEESVAEARVTVHYGQLPPSGPKVARVAHRREIYAIWATASCRVCGLEMPVNPNWNQIVSHYPRFDEHRYDRNPSYYCRGSNDTSSL